jgi:hypothetical protein
MALAGQDVQVPAGHERWHGQLLEELCDPDRDSFDARPSTAARLRPAELVQVRGGGRIEL